MSIGSRLRALRESRGLTQERLATALGVNRSSVAYYELNRQTPSLEVIQRAADFFQVSLDYILGRSDCAYPEPPGWWPVLDERTRHFLSQAAHQRLLQLLAQSVANGVKPEDLEKMAEVIVACSSTSSLTRQL